MKFISSLAHEEIKNVVKLQGSKGRKQQNAFLIEGIKGISTAIEKGFKLKNIYVNPENAKLAETVVDTKKISVVTISIMNKISSLVTPPGVLAVFEIPKPDIKYLENSGLVLAQIQDPGNMGTLIRTAAACNIKTVIIIEGCDPWSPKVIQATAGTISFVNIFSMNWSELLNIKGNRKLIGLIAKDGISINKLVEENFLFVVGNESKGLPEEWQKSCDLLVTLNMPGHIESLNAAVAGSIALYITTVLNKNIKT